MNFFPGNRKILGTKGQLTIFLGIALIVTVSFIAFIVNVGLFVKAKINLQNATDAAAWAGAAVQARQLSNIAYVNYQFRQIFKEWMLKYYILGNIGGFGTDLTLARNNGNNVTNFRTDIVDRTGGASLTSNKNEDKYNVPSICTNINNRLRETQTDICLITSVPGIPRFEKMSLNLGNKDRDWINAISETKAQECARRTDKNFSTALTWTYGTGKSIIPGYVMASNRMGAWTKSFLTAIRVRNLEAIVNRPPIVQGISVSGLNNTLALNSLDHTIYNERPIKAFSAAYRNLGGGIKKEGHLGDVDELANELILTELAPEFHEVTIDELSGHLIPENETYPSGELYRQKYYLDLQIQPINYAILYAIFLTKSDPNLNPSSTSGVIATTAECNKIKAILPAPAYIKGFIKNNRMLTYYSVKAETRFMGLFFPFYRNIFKGIQLKAYASAKPFGGRIGPQFFKIDPNKTSIHARSAEPKKSAPYLIGLDDVTPSLQAGDPLPGDPAFYLQNSIDAIGGIPAGRQNPQVSFAIPNMIYDFPNSMDEIRESLLPGGNLFLKLKPEIVVGNRPNPIPPDPSEPKVGLYDWNQFKMFRDNTLGSTLPNVIDEPFIQEAIRKSQMVTKYDALNWMVPLRRSPNMASPTTAIINSNDPNKYVLYAPLYGPNTLYPNPQAIVDVATQYIEHNKESFNVFLNALKTAADDILAQGALDGGQLGTYEDAAQKVYPLIDSAGGKATANGNMELGSTTVFKCNSTMDPYDLPMATKFYYFFRFDPSQPCPMVPPLLLGLEETINEIGIRGEDVYISNADYLLPSMPSVGPDEITKLLSTAYSPGPAQGAKENGDFPLVFGNSGNTFNHKRNYYSTKFIHTAKLLAGGNWSFDSTGNLYQEFLDSNPNNFSNPNSADFQLGFLNPLNNNDLKEFNLNRSGGNLAGKLAY